MHTPDNTAEHFSSSEETEKTLPIPRTNASKISKFVSLCESSCPPKVLESWKENLSGNEEEQRYVIVGSKPPDEKEFKKRKIPRGIRHTGYFRSSLLENKKISQKLDDRIEKSESDRRELIHRFMYFQKDLMDKHIIDVMELFREIDKLIQKHKRVNKNLL